ncbi:MAG: hypothetical protein E6I87_07800 [Chloroflexi bacterium]|nr:MAG: hypothetical protein E6I87_07800 [Chloroflexota bacterium]
MMQSTSAAQGIYNALFPYYAELCVVTQSHKKGAQPGGWGGHAALFLNGAEPDPAAGHPRLRLAAAETDLSRPDSGTGISVNKIFTNTNWVAIPGRDEFYRGGLAPDQSLDQAFYDAAVQRATAARWFAGIRIGDDLLREKPSDMSVEDFIVRHSIGTDFALNFARTAYTVRLPLRRSSIRAVIDYLNGANERAQRIGYRWNAYTNNCSHVLHNALAAAGVWDPKDIRGSGAIDLAADVFSVAKGVVVGRMSDFSFPANNFVRLYEAGNERPIDDALAAFRNRDVVRTLNEGWISTGPGALIGLHPMQEAARNELFAAGRDPFLFSIPMFWDKRNEFERLTRKASTNLTDLGANLMRFRERYAKALTRRQSIDEGLRSVPGDDHRRAFRSFYDRFYAQLAEELRRTDDRLSAYQRVSRVGAVTQPSRSLR